MSEKIITVEKEVYGLFYGCYKLGQLFKCGSTGFIEVGEKFKVSYPVFWPDGFIEIKQLKPDERIAAPFVFHLSYAEFQKAFPGIDFETIEYE